LNYFAGAFLKVVNLQKPVLRFFSQIYVMAMIIILDAVNILPKHLITFNKFPNSSIYLNKSQLSPDYTFDSKDIVLDSLVFLIRNENFSVQTAFLQYQVALRGNNLNL